MLCGLGDLSGHRRGRKMFGGLGLKRQIDGFLERNILKIITLKRERDQERLSLKEG